jgi:methionyl aminopeptidase
MINIKTPEEVAKMKEGGHLLAQVLQKVSKTVRPGIKLQELEKLTVSLIKETGGAPSFLNYKPSGQPLTPFPTALCVSINEEIVHGMADRDLELKEGDIVGLDCGLKYKGMFTDHALTLAVGNVSNEAQELIEATEKALAIGLKNLRAGAYTGDIGWAVQQFVESKGLSVVRDLVGHGVGRAIHEPPSVPNYGQVGQGVRLEAGMTIAVEPMVAAGDWHTKTLEDGWTAVTADGSLSAHFEHTVLVTPAGREILTKH